MCSDDNQTQYPPPLTRNPTHAVTRGCESRSFERSLRYNQTAARPRATISHPNAPRASFTVQTVYTCLESFTDCPHPHQGHPCDQSVRVGTPGLGHDTGTACTRTRPLPSYPNPCAVGARQGARKVDDRCGTVETIDLEPHASIYVQDQSINQSTIKMANRTTE